MKRLFNSINSFTAMVDFLGSVTLRHYLCGFFFIFTAAAAVEDYYDDKVERRREWTEWFNTDSPDTGTGDDESLASIRKLGFTICKDDTPVDAVCRVASEPDVVFNVATSDFTEDVLVMPCTSIGIVCRNTDQGGNGTCKDYAIRFQCLTVFSEEAQMGNLGLIGIAAGLSVIVPILCVTCMHVTRMLKERNRRLQQDQDEEENTDQSRESSSNEDLPPSYSTLFGELIGSTEQLLADASRYVVPIFEEGDRLNMRNNTNLGSAVANRDTTSQDTIYSIPSSPQLSRNASFTSTNTQVDFLPQSHRGNRCPGMHLSIIDLIISTEESNSNQDSNDTSYIQTPPPSYNEAIVILGGVPYKTMNAEEQKPEIISDQQNEIILIRNEQV